MGALHDFEKLGAFYLGKRYDLEQRRRSADLLLYDSKDLVTHAVCVGMTGSGKTGLCISLLEEAAIDGIPAIIIDPKGDLANLALTFPGLGGADFRPWINEADAAARGVSPDAFAEAQAALWTKGLGEWGQDSARIRKFREAAEVRIYTPGSNAGTPVSIVRSFGQPSAEVIEDTEAFRERVGSTAASLLGLLGIDADPVRSREHILLSGLFSHAWHEGTDLDLAAIIRLIQQPPFTRVGVMELETFYPAKERFGLAMQLNSLLASPGFASWMEGEPLDIASILHTPAGKPRLAVFSIAHLGDAERMFFVSLLLNQFLAWTRAQSGTSSLRAILYMDEIAGYFPPTANPPSKQPLLTLMKQARAFGVGCVLVTQNPVDLDYKGLANAGTWFIGRMQTERDKARVLDGLEGAAAAAGSGFDRADADRIMSSLGNRVFLLNNVHDDGPVIFESRWAMSYLRGPLTRQQIRSLTAKDGAGATGGAGGESAEGAGAEGAGGTSTPTATGGRPAGAARGSGSVSQVQPASAQPVAVAAARRAAAGNQRPVLPAEIPAFFIPHRASSGEAIRYIPRILGCARIYYNDAKLGIEHEREACFLAPFADGAVTLDWNAAEATTVTERDLERDPELGGASGASGAAFDALPADAGKPRSYEAWKKTFADMLFRRDALELLRSEAMELTSRPGESERDFRLRLVQAAREQRDALADELRAKYAPKVAALEDRIRRAEQVVAKQKEQAGDAGLSTALSIGAAILGAFVGRKSTKLTAATRAAKGIGRSVRESGDVGRAEENVEALRRQLAEVETQFGEDLATQSAAFDPTHEVFEKVALKPKKTNIAVRAVVLAWAPHTLDAEGRTVAAWG